MSNYRKKARYVILLYLHLGFSLHLSGYNDFLKQKEAILFFVILSLKI